jgi:hypothetical protein
MNQITYPLIAHTDPDFLRDSQASFQALLLELLAASRTASSPRARHFLASARACARALSEMDSLQRAGKNRAASSQGRESRLQSVLERTTRNPREQDAWQAMLTRGEYKLLVAGVERELLKRPAYRSRQRGMEEITRRLAERALRLKATGVSWSSLLDAVVRELQGEPHLDAEEQVLLTRLLERQAHSYPHENGAYLRLTLSRYQAELAAADLRQPAAEGECQTRRS